jgi:hypothetical protein
VLPGPVLPDREVFGSASSCRPTFLCHLPGYAAEALRRNEPDFRSARPVVLSFEIVTQALKMRADDECRQRTRLTDHFALLADAALAFVCESLHACENRIGVEVRFRDHFQFEAAASP